MVDLKNGVFEIDDQELSSSITPDGVQERFGRYITYQDTIDSLTTIYLDDVILFEVQFELKLSFKSGKLSYIRLESRHQYEGEHTWKRNFELDNLWLKEQLGEPDHVIRTDGGSGPYTAYYSNAYDGKGCRIYSLYRDDPRCGEDASIMVNYGE